MLEEGFYCVPEAQLEPLQRTIYCALSLASGVAGLGGAAWQALQWRPFLRAYQRRRRPSPNPLIVVSLAVADLLACLGKNLIIRNVLLRLCIGHTIFMATNIYFVH